MRGQGKTLAALLCAALAMSALCAGAAIAAPKAGTLDRSFGSNGRVVAPFAGDYRSLWIEAVPSPGGATVVADRNQLFRFLPDGRLDPSFGTGGVVRIFDPSGFEFVPSALDVDSHGRPVLFGTTIDSDPKSEILIPSYVPGGARPSYAMVQRYGAEGALDPAFNGDGIVETDFGLPKAYSVPTFSVTTGAVDGQDRPVLVGARRETIYPCDGHSDDTDVDKLVARLNTDGQFDPTFGAGASLVPLGGILEAADLAFGPDDGPIVLGDDGPKVFGSGAPTGSYPCPLRAVIVRMDAAGNPYGPYGSYGLRYLRAADPRDAGTPFIDVRPRSLAVDPRGRVLVLAGPQVLRLDPTGRPDPRFGRLGAATVNLPGHRSSLSSFGLDPQGRILLSGTTTRSAAADGINRPAFAAVRLL